jgi:hypothetical protein
VPSGSLLAAPDSVTGDPEMTLWSVPALAVGAVLLTTVIVTDCCAVPPVALAQFSEKMVVAVSAPVGCEPVVGFASVQFAFAGVAVAVQLIAFWVTQFKVELPPAQP